MQVLHLDQMVLTLINNTPRNSALQGNSLVLIQMKISDLNLALIEASHSNKILKQITLKTLKTSKTSLPFTEETLIVNK